MLSLKNESKINALCFVPKNKQFNLGIKSQQWHSQPDLLNGLNGWAKRHKLLITGKKLYLTIKLRGTCREFILM